MSQEMKEGTLELKGNEPNKGATPDNLRVQAKGNAPSPVNLTSAERQNEIRNYEISKVNKHVRSPMGRLAKVSAAVVVDGTYQGTGKNRQYVSRNPEEMKNLENIVKTAIGYNEERKDQVEVINMPFYWSGLGEETTEEKTPVWEKYLQQYYKPVISLILAFLLIFFVVRPLLKKKGSGSGKGGSLSPEVDPSGEPFPLRRRRRHRWLRWDRRRNPRPSVTKIRPCKSRRKIRPKQPGSSRRGFRRKSSRMVFIEGTACP